jgi:drug/metabolite transporter (DMT)-like permease
MSPAPGRGEAGAVAAMVAATLLWGATFVVIRDSLGAIDAMPLVFGRFAVAALALAVLHAALRRRPTRDGLAGGIASGALMTGGFLFQAIGLESTSAGSSAFLTCAGTLFAALFAWPLLRVRPGAHLLAGIGLALAGSALLAIRGGAHLGRGETWTVLGAWCFALQIVAVARWAPRADALMLAAVQAATVAVLLVPAAGTAAAQLAALDAGGAWRVAYLVVAGSVVAPFLQMRAQRVLSPGRTGLLFALEPLFAVGFAVTLGAERYDVRWWLGAALILGGVLAVEGRAARAAASGHPATAPDA